MRRRRAALAHPTASSPVCRAPRALHRGRRVRAMSRACRRSSRGGSRARGCRGRRGDRTARHVAARGRADRDRDRAARRRHRNPHRRAPRARTARARTSICPRRSRRAARRPRLHRSRDRSRRSGRVRRGARRGGHVRPGHPFAQTVPDTSGCIALQPIRKQEIRNHGRHPLSQSSTATNLPTRHMVRGGRRPDGGLSTCLRNWNLARRQSK